MLNPFPLTVTPMYSLSKVANTLNNKRSAFARYFYAVAATRVGCGGTLALACSAQNEVTVS
jgi:hypothetical protein